ncbi:hypothetical protein HKD37_09G024269 [Glycine soja]
MRYEYPIIELTSSTQSKELEFKSKLDLPNEEFDPFSEDEDEVLRNQPNGDHKEEAKSISLITIVPPYYLPSHMHNFEESNFKDFDYSRINGANYKTQQSNSTKLIVICDDDRCAWRCKATYILASKQWKIRKLCEPHTCSNPTISQDHTMFSYLLISKSIHTLIENDPSTLVSALIGHMKCTKEYITTYQ